MSTLTYERLYANLERLRLTKISEVLDNYLERANKENISIPIPLKKSSGKDK